MQSCCSNDGPARHTMIRPWLSADSRSLMATLPPNYLASTLSKLYAEISKREGLFLYIFVGMTCDTKRTTRNSLLFLTPQRPSDGPFQWVRLDF